MNRQTPFSMRLHSPLGILLLQGTSTAITRVGWVSADSPPESLASEHCALLEDCAAQLLTYFDGSRTQFDLPLAPQGTSFQERVWRQLHFISHGETCSYSALATRLGSPGSARAVGSAVRSNPLLILQPCHRVVGADGSMTGYSGGLPRKEWLLAHEGALPEHPKSVSGI